MEPRVIQRSTSTRVPFLRAADRDEEPSAFSLREVLHEEPVRVAESIPLHEAASPPETRLAAEARRLVGERIREGRERTRLLTGAVPVELDPEPEDAEDDGEEAPVVEVEDAGAVGRQRRAVPGKTIDMRRVSLRERRRLTLATPAETYWRPGTRADCASLPRPCPYVTCQWHLLLDVPEPGTSVKLNFPDLVEDRLHHGPLREDGSFFTGGGGRLEEGPFLEEMAETCALDVAANGAHTHEEIAPLLNLSRERIRQVEDETFVRLKKKLSVREMAALLDMASAESLAPLPIPSALVAAEAPVSPPAAVEASPAPRVVVFPVVVAAAAPPPVVLVPSAPMPAGPRPISRRHTGYRRPRSLLGQLALFPFLFASAPGREGAAAP